MRALLEKEVRLVVHPSTYVLAILGVLVLIPSWMYGAIFIYGVLVTFFNGMNAREMRDLEYSFALPVSRASMVCARVLTVMAVELFMMAVLVAFMLLREPLGINTIADVQEGVGTAANLYLVGFGFMVFALFNATFYPIYYRDPAKVGLPFLVACVPAALGIAVVEALPYLPVEGLTALGVPGLHDLGAQLACVGCGAVLFAVSGLVAIRLATRSFAGFDL